MADPADQQTQGPSGPGPDPKRTSQMNTGDRLVWNRKLDRMFAIRQSPEGHTNQGRYIRNVRQMGREFAQMVIENTPTCADQSAALRCIREAVNWAEDAIHMEGLV